MPQDGAGPLSASFARREHCDRAFGRRSFPRGSRVEASKGDRSPEPPPRKARSSSCPNATVSLAAGRKATRAKRYAEAIEAFDEAIRARPADARLRSERGFAYLLDGNARRAKVDFEDAATLTEDRDLLAQIWFNVGLAGEKLGTTDEARLAFVVAEHHGSKAATSKLGAGARCPATFTVSGTDGAPLPIARGFDELAGGRQIVNCTLPLFEAPNTSARELACHGCGYGNGDEGHQCKGSAPWAIASGYMHFHTFTFFVIPIGKDHYYYENAIDASEPPRVHVSGNWLTIDGDPNASNLVHGDLLTGRFANDADTFVRSGGGWSDEMDYDGTWLSDAGPGCTPNLDSEVPLGSAIAAQMGGTPTFPDARFPAVTTFGSISDGRTRLVLKAYAKGVSATVDGTGAHVRGAGCQMDAPWPK